MFTEFLFVVAGKPHWRESLEQYVKEKDMQAPDSVWLDKVESVLVDYRTTKRAGVIVNVETTELWEDITLPHLFCADS